MKRRIITFGTFDLFHIGHLKILERAKKEGDYLIVGISSDELNIQKGKSSNNRVYFCLQMQSLKLL